MKPPTDGVLRYLSKLESWMLGYTTGRRDGSRKAREWWLLGIVLGLMLATLFGCYQPAGPLEKCGPWVAHEYELVEVTTGEVRLDTLWTQGCAPSASPVFIP